MAATAQVSMAELLERQQKLVEELANRFRNIVVLAADAEDDATAQLAATTTLQINVETQALIHTAEDFLSFTRQLKELWLFGTVRELGEGEEEAPIEKNATLVGEMIEKMIKMTHAREAGPSTRSDQKEDKGVLATGPATNSTDSAASVANTGTDSTAAGAAAAASELR